MKTVIIKLIVLSLILMSCKKDDDQPTDPIDQLPPPTMTGENTIGCLVNGVPFTDSGLMNNFYQFIDGNYFLAINWDIGITGNFKDGQINIRRIQIMEGQTYLLNINSIQNDFTGGSANYTFQNGSDSGEFETDSQNNGSITFLKFDQENNIMSGIFEFQAKEITTGEIINITDGRFDLTFTN